MATAHHGAGAAIPRGTGFVVPFPGLPLSAHGPAVRALADAGYTSAWAGEADGADAFATLVAVATGEPRLRVGTAVVPAATRGPALLAMAAATLAEAATAGAAIGVGASSATVVEGWNAVPYDVPYARVRDVVRFLRLALAGERVVLRAPTFSVDGFRLGRPPVDAPALLVGALGPAMLRLAGREGDGVVLTCCAPADVAAVVPVVQDAARGAGRPAPEVVAWVTVCPTTDTELVRGVARRRLAGYLTAPPYAAFQRARGRADVLDPLWRAWEVGDRRAAVAAIPDAVVDELVVHGEPVACRTALDAFTAAGATTLVLEVLPGTLDPLEALLALAPRPADPAPSPA
jgi:probable F420-dependent oxidoreductase